MKVAHITIEETLGNETYVEVPDGMTKKEIYDYISENYRKRYFEIDGFSNANYETYFDVRIEDENNEHYYPDEKWEDYIKR